MSLLSIGLQTVHAPVGHELQLVYTIQKYVEYKLICGFISISYRDSSSCLYYGI